MTETLHYYPPSMAILNFPFDYVTTRQDFITREFMDGYQKYKDDYVEYMSRDESIASDGTPLANHFLVMTLKN